MSVSENVAYLKGLMEGLDLDEDKAALIHKVQHYIV